MAGFQLTHDATTQTLHLAGALTLREVTAAAQAFADHRSQHPDLRVIDIHALTALDTAGALLLADMAHEQAIAGASVAHRALLELVSSLPVHTPAAARSIPAWRRAVVQVGRYMVAVAQDARCIVTFMGKAASVLAHAVCHPRQLRLGSICHHIEAIGVHALPIIGLIAFLIAVVLAYQGVAQLRPYGGEAFTVDLVAISILREMGVLLTAIMVAGRSGSAFTAEIGVMKAREEVDALEAMGFDPFEMLVVPRLVAIIISLPLLTFFANILGMVGGFFIIHALTDISLPHYLERIQLSATLDDLIVGMVKAPVFAFFIGVIGCMHGLRVTGSAESIGRETTTSVVKGIFLVLALDAFFSILFQQVGM